MESQDGWFAIADQNLISSWRYQVRPDRLFPTEAEIGEEYIIIRATWCQEWLFMRCKYTPRVFNITALLAEIYDKAGRSICLYRRKGLQYVRMRAAQHVHIRGEVYAFPNDHLFF